MFHIQTGLFVCPVSLRKQNPSLPAELSYRLFKWDEVIKEEIRTADEATPSISDQLPSACPMSWEDIRDNLSPLEAKEPGKQEALYTPDIKSVFVWSIASLWTAFLFSFLMTQISLVGRSDMDLFSHAATHVFNSSIWEALEKLSSMV